MRRPAIVLATILLSGCASVQSENKIDFKEPQRGFTYFLPTRFVKLTATKEVLDSPKIKAALDAKTKELEAAKAVAAAADGVAKAKAEVLANLPPNSTDATRS